ncbi:MAG TPA: hypothetical protein ENL18_03490 [Thermoplasmatales archaeon]|nr:hypothetical protein [Thermoplasmatales archaeon]
MPDNEPPSTELSSIPPSPNGNDSWYVSNIWFGFNSSDLLSGINYTKYSIDGGDWKNYEDYEVIADDGYHSIQYYSVDEYGNKEKTKNISLKVDKTAPYTVLEGDGNESYWHRIDFIGILDGQDNMSGLENTYYRVNGGVFSTYIKPFNITLEGINTLEYFSKDNAGNAEQLKSVNIKIDKTVPDVVSVSPKKSYLYVMGREIIPLDGFDNFAIIIGGIDININARDSVSGIQRVDFYLDNSLRYTDDAAPYTWNWNETAVGPYTIKAMVYDVAGNAASVDIPAMVLNIQ